MNFTSINLLASKNPINEDCAAVLSTLDLKNFLLQHSLTLSPKAFAQQLLIVYPELKWLVHKVEISPEDASAVAHPEAFSTALWGELHPEVERTMTSLVVLQQILKGDFEGFSKSQIPAIKLKPASFDYIRQVFFKILGHENWNGPIPVGQEAINAVDIQKLDALITYMVIHDLGKSKSFKFVAEKVSAKASVDHDRVLVYGLNSEPMLSTSFERLPEHFKKKILAGMEADFNMGQFAQAENVPASLNKLSGLDKDSFDFYFTHLFLDVAGSMGVKDPTGAKVMIEPVFNGFRTGYEFLPHLYEGMGSDQVYRFFLQQRAASLGLAFNDSKDYAVARLALLSRSMNPVDAAKVKFSFESLEQSTKDILVREMGITGNGTEQAILPYYAPALIVNYRTSMKKTIESTEPAHIDAVDVLALQDSYKFLAEAMHLARISIKDKKGPGVFTLGLNSMATMATKDPAELKKARFKIGEFHGDGADLIIERHVNRSLHTLSAVKSEYFEKLPKNIVMVALGGGSDVVQAELVGRLLSSKGKNLRGIISVQGAISSNPSREGAKLRSIDREKARLTPTLVSVGARTTMKNTSRFLEPAVAKNSKQEVLLILKDDSNHLAADLQIALTKLTEDLPADEDCGIIAIDTGGDLLHPRIKIGETDSSVTPDQDQEVFHQVMKIAETQGNRVVSMVVAPGIDSPNNLEELLKGVAALKWDLSAEEKEKVFSGYAQMRVDGSDPARFSKTAPMWKRALEDATGKMVLPLPSDVTSHPTNPWNPFVFVEDAQKSIVIIDGKKLEELIK